MGRYKGIFVKTFLFMGPNLLTKSRVSWKIWKIERKGKSVSTYWAPAMLDGRRPLKVGAVFNTKTRRFKSEDVAKAFEEQRIKVKLRKGYKRTLRRSMPQ